MALPLYTQVRLATGFSAPEVPPGAHGYVIEDHDNHQYEIEFSDPATGVTFAQIVAPERALVRV